MRQRNETQKQGGGMVSFSEHQKERLIPKKESLQKGLRHQRKRAFLRIERTPKKAKGVFNA
ncbi:hypothetical protein [Helicobacter pylori]|uniref:hypothetical protein n=1 Tax=Helicobacter pylori TaxID=210 RepID=UPI0015E6CD1E|nr:hypothetical protein [Helicobacter pylori]